MRRHEQLGGDGGAGVDESGELVRGGVGAGYREFDRALVQRRSRAERGKAAARRGAEGSACTCGVAADDPGVVERLVTDGDVCCVRRRPGDPTRDGGSAWNDGEREPGDWKPEIQTSTSMPSGRRSPAPSTTDG
jgi:hypothetical protein